MRAPKWTRQDFEYVAQLVRSAPLCNMIGRTNADEDMLRVHLAEYLGDTLGATNAQFDKDKFVQACLRDIAL